MYVILNRGGHLACGPFETLEEAKLFIEGETNKATKQYLKAVPLLSPKEVTEQRYDIHP